MNDNDYNDMASGEDGFIKRMNALLAPIVKDGTTKQKAEVNKVIGQWAKISHDPDKDSIQKIADMQAIHRKFTQDNAVTSNK